MLIVWFAPYIKQGLGASMIQVKPLPAILFSLLVLGCQQISHTATSAIQLEKINEPMHGILSATGTMHNSFPFDICLQVLPQSKNTLIPTRLSDLADGLVDYSDPDELTPTSLRPFLLDYEFYRVQSGATVEVKGHIDLRDFYALKKADGTLLKPPPRGFYGFEMTLVAVQCDGVQIYVDPDTSIEMIKGSSALDTNLIWLVSGVTGNLFIDPHNWHAN